MKKRFIKCVAATALSLIIISPAISYGEKNTNAMYLIERKDYDSMLSEENLIIKPKNLMIVEDQITKENINETQDYNNIYLLGKPQIYLEKFNHKELEERKFYKNGDILIVDKNSLADQMTASELSELFNMNILFVDDELSEENIEWLNENGLHKNIVFVEGARKFSDEFKKEIFDNSPNIKYVIDELNIYKNNINSGNTIKSNSDVKTKSNKTKDSIIKKASSLNNKQEKSDSIIKDRIKLVSFDVEKENIKNNNYGHEELNKEDKLNKLLDVIESNSLDYKLNDEVEEAPKGQYTLKLTYANSVNASDRVDPNKNVYISYREITEEIISDVRQGGYGEEEELVENIEALGYNYDEVEKGIEKIEREERLAREAAFREEEEEKRKEAERAAEERREQLATMAAPENSINNRSGDVIIPTEEVVESTEVIQPIESRVNQKFQISKDQMAKLVGHRSVEDFVNEALKMQGWEYSQARRWEYGYADCSSLVVRALINSGLATNSSNLTSRSIHQDSRFRQVPMNEIQRGDVLWHTGHVEIYMGGNQTFGAFRPGKPAGYGANISRFTMAYRINGI